MDDTVLKARLKIGLLSRMISRVVVDEQVWECLRRKMCKMFINNRKS